MWQSFQVYTDKPGDFFDSLYDLIVDNEIFNDSFFFTQYYDVYGYHIRFRFQKNHRIFLNWLEKEQFICIETIYDPDLIRYGSYNQQYEKFSTITCYYIINNKIYCDFQKRLSYVLGIIDLLLKLFNINRAIFVSKYIKYWGSRYSYSKPRIAKDEFRNLEKNIISLNHTSELSDLLNTINTNHNEKFCFYFIHLTMNRLSLTISDEIDIINLFMKYDWRI